MNKRLRLHIPLLFLLDLFVNIVGFASGDLTGHEFLEPDSHVRTPASRDLDVNPIIPKSKAAAPKTDQNSPISPQELLKRKNVKAMSALSSRRRSRKLGTVKPLTSLARRCYDWLVKMSRSRMHHDPKVYGSPERENLAGGSGFSITIVRSLDMWDRSAGHAASMYDRGFPKAMYGGYAEYNGYSCLRLCPSKTSTKACSGE